MEENEAKNNNINKYWSKTLLVRNSTYFGEKSQVSDKGITRRGRKWIVTHMWCLSFGVGTKQSTSRSKKVVHKKKEALYA